MGLPAAYAAAKLGGGLIKFLAGDSQKGEGKRLLAQIGESPNMPIPDEVLRNQKMAELRANTGMPSQQYFQALRNLHRMQLGRLKQAYDRKGALGMLAGSEQGLNDAILKLDVENSNRRLENEKTLYNINNNVAGWKNKAWNNNIKDVWNRKYQYGMSLVGAGNQNKMAGVDQLLSGGIDAVGGMNFGRAPKQTTYMDRTDFDTFE